MGKGLKSWCSRSRIQLLGTSDKWRRASSLQISQLSVPLTAQHLHLRLAELQTYPGTRCARVSIEQLHVHIQMCSDRRYTGVGSCWFQRKMVCWVEAMPRPRPLLPPLEGGGRQPCTGLLDVLPPVRKSPVSRCSQLLSASGTFAGRVAGMAVGEGVRRCMAPMHPHMLLDVCVLLPRCCASVAVVMSSAVRCVSMRLVLSPRAVMVTARLLAGAAHQRTASRGAQSAE